MNPDQRRYVPGSVVLEPDCDAAWLFVSSMRDRISLSRTLRWLNGVDGVQLTISSCTPEEGDVRAWL